MNDDELISAKGADDGERSSVAMLLLKETVLLDQRKE